MRFSTLDAWLQWQQNCHVKAIDLGLERVAKVAQTLGLLQPRARVVTVAGTNGKGSCVAALEAICMGAGLRVGAFTSPHLLQYNERVRVDQQQVGDADLCRAFAAIDQARGDITLTYFEFGALAALFLFAEQALDVWVLEVGLGGRLDATNIIDADVAVITSIDLDHVEWLGDDREAIGREKAGIFRTGRPAVCADARVPSSVLEQARALDCPLALINDDFGFEQLEEKTRFWSGDCASQAIVVELSRPSLAAAVHVAQLLEVGSVGRSVEALQGLKLPGRMQQLEVNGKTVVLDVAHNPAATQQFALQLAQGTVTGKVVAIVAMMADKNLQQALAPLCPLVDEWALCAIADVSRAAKPAALAAVLPPASDYTSYANVAQALEHHLAAAEVNLILVTGSFYTVAEALRWLNEHGEGNEAAR